VLDAIGIVRILDAHAHPNIFVPRKFSGEFDQPFRSLSQNLERVPISFSHDFKGGLDKFEWYVWMEKIAH
jgi:hypothetical protein